jgi:tyrosinase
MLLMTSPDDPVFFLHRCFIDKVWADWQELQKTNNPDGAPHYAPLQDGPAGHNIDDDLRPAPTPSGKSWTSRRSATSTSSRRARLTCPGRPHPSGPSAARSGSTDRSAYISAGRNVPVTLHGCAH